MTDEVNQEAPEQQVTDGLTGSEYGELEYTGKRTDKGLPPGVNNANVQKHQSVDPKDPGLPRAGDIVNKRPLTPEEQAANAEKAKAEEEKAKVAEAEAAELKQKEEEQKKADEAKDDPSKEIQNAEYVTYNDPAADAAVEMLREKGIDPKVSAEWFKGVLESGDINKMDTAAMEAVLGKKDATLVATAVKDYYSRQFQSIQKTTAAVEDVLGGKEALGKVRTWMNTLTPEHPAAKEVTDLLGMMERGEYSAKVAAKELKALFEADPNNKSLSIKQVHGDGTPPETFTTLTRAEYLTEMKLAQAAGDQKRVAELRANRARAHSR